MRRSQFLIDSWEKAKSPLAIFMKGGGGEGQEIVRRLPFAQAKRRGLRLLIPRCRLRRFGSTVPPDGVRTWSDCTCPPQPPLELVFATDDVSKNFTPGRLDKAL